jgi:hypothetical protein
MQSILYAIGFTLALCLSVFFGYSEDAPYYQQALMFFGGFCLGGIVLLVIENFND